MTDIKSVISQILEQTAAEIRANLDTQRVTASGRSRDSIRVRETEDGHLQLIGGGEGAAPMETLETGRKAGKVPRGFEDILKEWMVDKGVNVEDEDKFARSLKWRIIRKGTLRHFDLTQQKDIYSTPVSMAASAIIERGKEALGADIKTAISALHFSK